MATVISNEELERHNVDKYNFKVLGINTGKNEKTVVKSNQTQTPSQTQNQTGTSQESSVDSSAMSQKSKDSLIESLLKKTDEMSSNFIKLQMKLEANEEEFKKEREEIKESAFNEGLEAGKNQALQDSQTNYQSKFAQLESSVATLERSAAEFHNALEGIKSELISAALDIAKEVIKVQLSTNADEVATLLSQELIKELQSASKVTLKVNPANHGALSEKLGKLENVVLVSDSAVSEGGVIAMSDAGNIDAQIAKRFERVKKAALSE